jgi:hypothetical protein
MRLQAKDSHWLDDKPEKEDNKMDIDTEIDKNKPNAMDLSTSPHPHAVSAEVNNQPHVHAGFHGPHAGELSQKQPSSSMSGSFAPDMQVAGKVEPSVAEHDSHAAPKQARKKPLELEKPQEGSDAMRQTGDEDTVPEKSRKTEKLPEQIDDGLRHNITGQLPSRGSNVAQETILPHGADHKLSTAMPKEELKPHVETTWILEAKSTGNSGAKMQDADDLMTPKGSELAGVMHVDVCKPGSDVVAPTGESESEPFKETTWMLEAKLKGDALSMQTAFKQDQLHLDDHSSVRSKQPGLTEDPAAVGDSCDQPFSIKQLPGEEQLILPLSTNQQEASPKSEAQQRLPDGALPGAIGKSAATPTNQSAVTPAHLDKPLKKGDVLPNIDYQKQPEEIKNILSDKDAHLLIPADVDSAVVAPVSDSKHVLPGHEKLNGSAAVSSTGYY